MLNLLNETQSLWQKLKQTEKPIYLYGMGDGADKALSALSRFKIPISGVFASDGFVRGHSFKGFKVESISDIIARHGNSFIALLCFAVDYEPMLSYLYSLNKKCEFYAPDLPVIICDETLFDMDYIKLHEQELDSVYEKLADEKSKEVFLNILNYKISGKVSYLKQATTEKSEVYTDIIKPSENETYVDLGAFTGDTIEEFLAFAKSAKTIYAMEPDNKNYSKLLIRAESLDIKDKLIAVNKAAWSESTALSFKGGKGGRNPSLAKDGERTVLADSVDNIIGDNHATVIKYDVEGAEEEAINGSAKTIARYSPKLMVSAYHKNKDIFALPLQILDINPNYKIYLRHHDYIPAWETNYYFVKY